MSVTVTTIYLFLAIVSTGTTGKVGFIELYRTADKAACDAHATEWNAALAPQKFACVKLDGSKMREANDD